MMKRSPGMSRDDFRAHYLSTHAPLALEHMRTLGHYVVNLTDDTTEEGVEKYDAITEMHFPSVEDFTDQSRLYATPLGGQAVVQDAAKLFGGGVAAFRVAGHVQRDRERAWPTGERAPGIKLIGLLRRKEGLTHEQFVDHWLHVHVPLVFKHVLGIGRYITNVVEGIVIPGGPEIDGIVEVHYTEPRTFDSAEGEQIMAGDVASFLSTPNRHLVGEYTFRE
jgi:uncharacterized protein (TIGR02118 family)